METSLVFFAGQTLETAAAEFGAPDHDRAGANAIDVEQGFQESGLREDLWPLQLQCQRLCRRAEVPDVRDVVLPNPLGPEGKFVDSLNYQPGGPGEIVAVRLFYQWPVFISSLLQSADMADSKRCSPPPRSSATSRISEDRAMTFAILRLTRRFVARSPRRRRGRIRHAVAADGDAVSRHRRGFPGRAHRPQGRRLPTRTVADLVTQSASVNNASMTNILMPRPRSSRLIRRVHFKATVSACHDRRPKEGDVEWSDTRNGTAHPAGQQVTLPSDALGFRTRADLGRGVLPLQADDRLMSSKGKVQPGRPDLMRPRLSDTVPLHRQLTAAPPSSWRYPITGSAERSSI